MQLSVSHLSLTHSLTGGFEHVCYLTNLVQFCIPGFWDAFDPLPAELAIIRDHNFDHDHWDYVPDNESDEVSACHSVSQC